MIGLMIKVLLDIWLILEPHLPHMQICRKRQFAYTIDGSTHKIKGIEEINVIH